MHVDLHLHLHLHLHERQQPPAVRVDDAHMLSFQKLVVYQTAIEFLAFTVKLLDGKRSGLADQLMRAAQSQPLNIAEGAGRRTGPDRARFYMHARGSAMESAAVVDAMRVMGTIDAAEHARGLALLTSIVAMLTKLAGAGAGAGACAGQGHAD